RCDYGFYLNGGINTSNRISNCYVLGANIVGYKVPSQYSTMVNPAVDACLGVCYDLYNFRGEVIAPGAESRNAECVFSFAGTSPYYTYAVITGAYTFGLNS